MASGAAVGGASRASRAAVERALGEVADDSSVDLAALGDELLAVVRLLDSEHGLRRTLSDATSSAHGRREMVGALLDGKVSAATLRIVQAAVSERWARTGDLADALERAAVFALVGSADRDGSDVAIEDELFRFARIVDGTAGLRRALSDAAAPADSKRALVRDLLGDQVSGVTARLADEAATHLRGRSVEGALQGYARMVAARRRELIAHVVTAVALSDEQRERLATTLARQYGRQVHLDIEVDPGIGGGIRVQVGDDLIDGTVNSRLADARRRLAG